jgi:hypothetical protein
MASDEIERFRREIVERGGKLADEIKGGKELDDVTLLREVMNTVGKEGQLGGSIRCVVSVSMLTEGWDANTLPMFWACAPSGPSSYANKSLVARCVVSPMRSMKRAF